MTGSERARPAGRPVGIVIPAHNEEQGIARLLGSLTASAEPGEFDILVVCNGCTDRTATIARTFDSVRVIEVETPSKSLALKRGNELCDSAPRLYVDADVLIGSGDVRAMRRTLDRLGILATAPERILARTGVSRVLSWYYDVWEALPGVSQGLFGRGVIALSEEGLGRARGAFDFIADDLAISDSFGESERAITTDAFVTVWPARTLRAMARRRRRVQLGVNQLDQAGGLNPSSRTTPRDLVQVARTRPALAVKIPIFVVVSIAYRLANMRSSRSTEWERDDSSRIGQ